MGLLVFTAFAWCVQISFPFTTLEAPVTMTPNPVNFYQLDSFLTHAVFINTLANWTVVLSTIPSWLVMVDPSSGYAACFVRLRASLNRVCSLACACCVVGASP